MTSNEIRELFLTFFEARDHLRMPSSSLVPSGDPTLLFTSAGMVPFKPYFLGEQTPPSKRLASAQKSFRTTDIDEVGDHKHLTFFEMLGNFSIGDYFKQDAMRWAWEFVTSKSEGLGLPLDRFYITIYQDDDETYRYWTESLDIPSQRIYRYGDSDNWWGPAGREGPCGPCSELHYDFGEQSGCGLPLHDPSGPVEGCHPNHDCERFVELWNLVFMQYYQDLEGSRTSLPTPSVDTGLGLERAASIMQKVKTLYETDLLQPLLERAEGLSGKKYGDSADVDYAIRVVSEHSRAAVFLISDGVVPGNEGRSYVLRRLIRRAMFYYERYLAPKGTFLTEMAKSVIQLNSNSYSDLYKNRAHIIRVLESEEVRFQDTLDRGTILIEKGLKTLSNSIVEHLKPNHKLPSPLTEILSAAEPGDTDTSGAAGDLPDTMKQAFLEPLLDIANGLPLPPARLKHLLTMARRISGQAAFILYDTYGFPIEVTVQVAREHGLEVDKDGFHLEMEAQRGRSRAAHVIGGGIEISAIYEKLHLDKVMFVGYKHLAESTTIASLITEGLPVETATLGSRVDVILKETPFYAEEGGQVGDVGIITGPNGTIRIQDTQSPLPDLIIHSGDVIDGDLSVGDPVKAEVDTTRRADTARNHSGTHLLHASLRQILGPHIRQGGSLVTSERLRFDYTQLSPLDSQEINHIQGLANQKIRENLAVTTSLTTYTEAIDKGALAFFGDKYGEQVRMVSMLDVDQEQAFSLELCGGTHVTATGEIGPLFILSDSSIGAGMRRIEAVTGGVAETTFSERSTLIQQIADRLDVPIGDLEERLDAFLSEMTHLRKELAQLERGNLRVEAQRLLSQTQDIAGVKVLTAQTSATNVEALREMGDWLKAELSSAVLVLALVQDGNPLLISMVTSDLTKRGIHAGNIVREAAEIVGGGGGGRPETGQAGGKWLDKLPNALALVPDIIRRELQH